jgi:DNA-binding response OmpR family regulator
MGKKILLIEDEKILSEMYKDKFSKAGFKVIVAFDSKEGLALAKKEEPDLIILDILLPREDGIEFLTWLKMEHGISSIPVVVFSNYDDPETKKKAYQLGVKEYLIKANYTPGKIVEKITSYLK